MRLFKRLRESAKKAQRKYRSSEAPPEDFLLPGVRRVASRKGGWVAIWDHGWPQEWSLTVLAILLNIRGKRPEETLRKMLRK